MPLLAHLGLCLLVFICAPWRLAANAAELHGQWQEKTEIAWNGAAKQLVRRSFRVWDPYPELGLEFSWRPATESGKEAGAVTGSGELIWYPKGASAYDHTRRYASYKGNLKNGLADGWGKLTLRSGLLYEGEWKDGRMEGQGSIIYESGERYRGRFAAGAPDGTGTYLAANGAASEAGPPQDKVLAAVAPLGALFRRKAPAIPAGLALSPPPIQLAPGGAIEVAQSGAPLAMTIYVDQVKNNEFKQADPEMASFVYGLAGGTDTVEIRLDAPEIMARWKGGAAIAADKDSWLIDSDQFAPVFLVIDVLNDSNQDAQITGGYVDVTESATDLEPYMEIASIYLSDEVRFDPTFSLINSGWGPVQNAKITYSFGPQLGGQTFVIDAGTFDQSTEVSTLPGFVASGVDVESVQGARYSCPSEEQVPTCLANVVRSGLFGQISGTMFSEYSSVYTQISGVIDYSYTDSQGSLQQRQSPISVKIPVLAFGEVAEGGAPGPINRDLPAIKLGLDGQNYRIPFSYRGPIGAQTNQRFAMTLDADKSSHHLFRIVLQLADGTTAATPPVDLLMFKPRDIQGY